MECVSCLNPNDPGRRYCRRCGLQLGAFCPMCNFLNAPDDDYCGGCGWDLRTLAGVTKASGGRQTGEEPQPAEPPPMSLSLGDEELEGLFNQPPPAAPAAEAPAAISQTDIDSFFKKLGEQGDVDYLAPDTGPSPSPENDD